jgi:single-stranded DNA-binding protein
MQMLATPFIVNGVGRIVEIGDLNKVGDVHTISVKLESERRRMSGSNQIIETDFFYVQLWDTGADVLKDRAKIGSAMNFVGELRNKKGVISLKINKFEIYHPED